ncbi:hypothetical protein ACG1BZ_15520 [Microbulbifer sp. CNSA002]|uniref:hypothetical protein n=1 Tax=unclassified Microbulbifer TaxID=2619833 RepID=UPI0039B4F9CF
MPAETRAALQSILDSPVGDKIRTSGTRIKLALTLGVDNIFEVVENVIYYHTDVKGHLNVMKKYHLNGDGNSSATLGSLLSHEIGHVIGANGSSEIWTVRNFENPYRLYYDLPARRSYWKENDIIE